MSTVKIVKGDKNFNLLFTIYDSDGNVVDLSDLSSGVLSWRSYTNGTVSSITGVVKSATDGTINFPIEEEFVSSSGKFDAEITLTYESGRVLTAPNISIRVIPSLK